MDFAKRQLEKYGWKEGQGLGKNENGITKPIKASLKFDNAGIGHDHGAEFTNNWWETVFNKASQNIDVKVDNDGVNIIRKSDPVEITTRNYSIKKDDRNSLYGSFLKTSKLTSEGIEDYNRTPVDEEPPKKKFETMTDEELFAACGGRTAHKGARHGLTLSGKLARIEKQEKMLLKKMKGCSIDEDSKILKKMRKLKSHKETLENEDTNDSVEPYSDSSCSSVKKKKKKGRKSVSFNDTVFEYQIPTSECDPPNIDNDPNIVGDNETLNSDEGIEKDIEDNKNQDDGHKSFEEPRFIVSDLSSVEKKKLKKKRKLEGKQRATMKFIQTVQDEDMEDVSSTQECKKRKLNLADAKFSDCKRSQPELESSEISNKKQEKKKKHKKSKKSEKNKGTEEQKMKHISMSLQNVCRISEEE
ncbi:G patch domain-containing protein 4 [Coccinella septempunctata]|uniref:G patch domain-containing protein 4 n=1 Tax=Coccinella septempunctata TaxID=41139 RepID=UPI001D0886DC|nr:G patch domain-containing protein 4 [Coccinella septempunctata]